MQENNDNTEHDLSTFDLSLSRQKNIMRPLLSKTCNFKTHKVTLEAPKVKLYNQNHMKRFKQILQKN